MLHKPAASSLAAFLVLLASLGLIACGDTDTSPEALIHGWVIADGPVSGAEVTLLDHEGNPIEGASDTSYETGTFALPVDHIPHEFTVVAEGGTMNGQAFAGELRATVLGFDPDEDSLVLTLGTTLASVYGQRADVRPEEAHAAVREFLAIYVDVDLGEGFREESAYFGARAFLAEALVNGGVDTYVGQLADDMMKPGFEAHSFPGTQENFGALDLASGVLQWAGYKATPIVLEHFGIMDREPTVVDLSRQLTQVSSQLDELDRRITALGSRLECKISLASGRNTAVTIGDRLSELQLAARRLRDLVNADPANTRLIQDLEDRLRRTAAGYENAPLHMNQFSMGIASLRDPGALRDISTQVTDCSRFVTDVRSAEIYDAWSFLYLQQLTACSLIMWYELDQESVHEAEQIGSDCDAYKAQFVRMEPALIPRGATYVYDSQQNLVWVYGGRSEYWVHESNANRGTGFGQLGVLIAPNEEIGNDVRTFLRTWRVPTPTEAKSAFAICDGSAAANLRCLGENGWSRFTTAEFRILIGDRAMITSYDSPYREVRHGQVLHWNGRLEDYGFRTPRNAVELVFVRPPSANERFVIR
ncbi:MAG: hypothetical protein R3B59_11360 [Dehalococcoidia bacterium]